MARPRKDGPRFPCGKPRPENKEDVPFNMDGVEQREVVLDQKLVLVHQRVPELQRLYEEGRLREHLRLAGERYIELVRQYRQDILGAPNPHAKIASMEIGYGHAEIDIEVWDIEVQKAWQAHVERLRDRYDEAFRALVRPYNGLMAKKTVDRLCLDNEPIQITDMDLLRVGLERLADVFGIEKKRAA